MRAVALRPAAVAIICLHAVGLQCSGQRSLRLCLGGLVVGAQSESLAKQRWEESAQEDVRLKFIAQQTAELEARLKVWAHLFSAAVPGDALGGAFV